MKDPMETLLELFNTYNCLFCVEAVRNKQDFKLLSNGVWLKPILFWTELIF